MAARNRIDPKGRSRWDVEGQHLGVRYFFRTKAGTKKPEALALERAKHEQIAAEQSGRKPEVLLKDVIHQWLLTKPHKNHANLVSKLNQLSRFVLNHQVAEAPEIARLAAQTWATEERRAKGPKGKPGPPIVIATVNRRLAGLKGALSWAGHEDVARKIKLRQEKNKREVYLSREQVLALAKCSASAELRSAIMIAAYSGLRAAELLAAKPSDLRAGTLSVMGKGDKPRAVPLPSLLRPHLQRLPLGMSYDQFYKGLLAARDAAGVPDTVTPHVLRHTYASWMINAGVDLLTLSKLMGHSSVAVTQRYAHLYDKTLRDAVRKLR